MLKNYLYAGCLSKSVDIYFVCAFTHFDILRKRKWKGWQIDDFKQKDSGGYQRYR